MPITTPLSQLPRFGISPKDLPLQDKKIIVDILADQPNFFTAEARREFLIQSLHGTDENVQRAFRTGISLDKDPRSSALTIVMKIGDYIDGEKMFHKLFNFLLNQVRGSSEPLAPEDVRKLEAIQQKYHINSEG